jgi:hypothetical protein
VEVRPLCCHLLCRPTWLGRVRRFGRRLAGRRVDQGAVIQRLPIEARKADAMSRCSKMLRGIAANRGDPQ